LEKWSPSRVFKDINLRDVVAKKIEFYKPPGYDRKIKEQCLQMYVNGMGFRAIERVMRVHHTTVISWVKKIGNKLDNVPPTEEIPQITRA